MTAAVNAKTWSLNTWSDGSKRSYPEPTIPQWADDLTLNTWAALSTVNNFADVQAADVGQYGTSGPDSVFEAWSGAALLTGLGNFGSVLHWGGGHLDYNGNEVYRFDLETLTWSRINEPSTAGNADGWVGPYTNGLLSDGTPHTAHTYYAICARGADKLVIGRRESDNNHSGVWQYSEFDPVAETWTNSTKSPTGLNLTNNDGIVYDSARDLIWFIESDFIGWASYDPDTDTMSAAEGGPEAYSPAGVLYLPVQDLIVLFSVAGSHTGPVTIDPANPGNSQVEVATSGPSPTFAAGDQARWSSNLERIVYYPNESNSIFLLDPTDWSWTERTLTGTSGTHTGAGTYGKFNVVDFEDGTTVALVADDPDAAVRAVKLKAAA